MLGMHSSVDSHSMVQELPMGKSYIVTGGAFVKQWQEEETADGILRGHGHCHVMNQKQLEVWPVFLNLP